MLAHGRPFSLLDRHLFLKEPSCGVYHPAYWKLFLVTALTSDAQNYCE